MRFTGSVLSAVLSVCSALGITGVPALADEGDGPTARYAEFGNAFAAAINARDQETLSELFDLGELVNTMANDLFDDAKDRRAYREGFLSHDKQQITARLFHGWLSQDLNAKYLRTMPGTRPVIRLDFVDGGHEYVLLDVQRKAGRIVATDALPLTTGRKISESLGIATQLILQPTDSILAKMFGRNYKADKQTLNRLARVGELQRSGDYEGAYNALRSLPDAVRDNRLLVDHAVQLASMVGEAQYHEELVRLERLYGNDESAGFMLIDYFFNTGEYDKAVQKIDGLIQFLGEDAALVNLLANFAYLSEDLEVAERQARHAIALERDFEDAYWSLVTILLESAHFNEVIVVLGDIEDTFGYEFAQNSFTDQVYSEFVQSAEFREWLP